MGKSTTTAAGMKIIPSGFRVITLPNGTAALQKTKRSRRKFKLPEQTRAKIATAARKIKIPVLRLGANIIPLTEGFMALQDLARANSPAARKFQLGETFNALVSPYVGVKAQWTGSQNKMVFAPMELVKGLLPNIMVSWINKSGILRGANQALAKTKLPVRLS